MLETIYGRQSIREALRAGRRVRRLLIAQGARDSAVLRDLVALATERAVPITEVERSELDRIADHHQGVAAEGEAHPYGELAELLYSARGARPPLYLVLDSLQDPQNFGTLLRT